MTTGTKTPIERIEEYVRLYGEGKSYREVGEVFGLDGSSVRKVLKTAGKLESISRKTTPERLEEYLRLYGEGKTYKQVGEVFKLDATTIRTALKRAGKLESRPIGRKRISPDRIEEYSKLYREDKTYKQIGEVFGLSMSTIHSALERAGKLESRPLSVAMRKKHVDLAVQKYCFGVTGDAALGTPHVPAACKLRGIKSRSRKEAAIKAHSKPLLAAEYWRWYEAGYSPYEIAEMYEVNHTGVSRLLKKHGYKLRSRTEAIRLAHSGKRLKPLAILPTAPKPLKPKQVAAKPKVDRTSKGLKLLNQLTANRTKA